MKIYTSYFGKTSKLKNIIPISIARYSPYWYKGKTFQELAPSENILNKYHNGQISKTQYDSLYFKELNLKDKAQILEQLEAISGGQDVALVCYEKEQIRCHRSVTARWLGIGEFVEAKIQKELFKE